MPQRGSGRRIISDQVSRHVHTEKQFSRRREKSGNPDRRGGGARKAILPGDIACLVIDGYKGGPQRPDGILFLSAEPGYKSRVALREVVHRVTLAKLNIE